MRTGARQWTVWGAGLLVVSAALVSAAWASQGAARGVADAAVWSLYLPALYVAISLSGNPHAPSDALLFAAFLLQTFLMQAMVAGLWGWLAARIAARRAGRAPSR